MKPIDQTILSSEDGVIHGNCLEACIASLLEIPIEKIPSMREGNGKWFMVMDRFLEENGFTVWGTCYKTDAHFGSWFFGKPHGEIGEFKGVDGFLIVSGASPRDYVTNGHAVIYKDGILVHDPHPSKQGIKSIEYFLLIERR